MPQFFAVTRTDSTKAELIDGTFKASILAFSSDKERERYDSDLAGSVWHLLPLTEAEVTAILGTGWQVVTDTDLRWNYAVKSSEVDRRRMLHEAAKENANFAARR